ncbi:hypothetical protein NIA71_17660 [Ihubacter massiliensis]|uniref:UDP-3-O-[3-hydroxymyristoyl] glucosamine N-acyltransferase n=1 Tax=Hominibacterium faecale TaxID=2839743 RepID=A0A9J6QY66_9FIRM|nr:MULTISPECIES: DapH/DapD/GlmU-related protein [Eubacteriales Family XIII. Incertae Sedis]MCO7123755.1 hypothetical protein [Ihubacter massiliensis]MCU7380410.1 hypothetical protein [Hominibacterium faecale]
MIRHISIREIVNHFGEILCYGNEDLIIDGLNLCNRKSIYKSVLSYAETGEFINIIKSNKSITAVILNEDIWRQNQDALTCSQYTVLVAEQPEIMFYKIHDYLIRNTDFYGNNNFDSIIGRNCIIDSSAVIKSGVIIGDHVVIGANTVICSGTIIEDNVVIDNNTTIGDTGFQIIKENGVPYNIRHAGKTRICESAYIASNCVIEKSLFEGETFIGKNVQIDSLTIIGHNSYIGENTVLTAGVIVCGSAYISQNAWIGVGSSILNKVTIEENALVGIGSVVTRDVERNSKVFGVPAKKR